MPKACTNKKTGRTHQGFAQAETLALIAVVTLAGFAALRQFGAAEERAITGQSTSSTTEQAAFGATPIAIVSQSQAGITSIVRHAADVPFVVPPKLRRVPANENQWFKVMKDKILPDIRAGRHKDPAYLPELVQVLEEATPGYKAQSDFIGRALIAMATRLDHPDPSSSGAQIVYDLHALPPIRIAPTPNLQRTTTFGKARNNGLRPEAAAFRMLLLAATDEYFEPKFWRFHELFAPELPKDVLELIDGVHRVFGDGIPASVRDNIFPPDFHNNKPSFTYSALAGQLLRALPRIEALPYEPAYVERLHLPGTDEVATTWKQLREIPEVAELEQRFGVLSWLEAELGGVVDRMAYRYELDSGGETHQRFKHKVLTQLITAVFAGKKVDGVIDDLLKNTPPGEGHWNDFDKAQAEQAFRAAAQRAQNYFTHQLNPSLHARTRDRARLVDKIRAIEVSSDADFLEKLVENGLALPSDAAAIRQTLAIPAKHASSIEQLRDGAPNVFRDPVHERVVLRELVASAMSNEPVESVMSRIQDILYRVQDKDGRLVDLSADKKRTTLREIKNTGRQAVADALTETRARINRTN